MPPQTSPPLATVAVSSFRRPLRLRWLLNALEQQSVGGAFEVVVAHDPACDETARLLLEHPLAAAGALKAVAFPAHTHLPGAGRNAAWRSGRAPLVAFTDDDCRPAEDWVERALARAAAHSGAVIQGRTTPDPDEEAVLLGAPWARTQDIVPPTPWAETCNIAYPRALLERLDGFREDMRVAEDAELAARARAAGAAFVAAPELRVLHAVEERSLLGTVRGLWRWGDLALLVARHPSTRRHLVWRLFWKPSHPALLAAAAGFVLRRRCPPLALLAAPWIVLSSRHRGFGPRGLLRSASELPGRAAIDATEILALAAAARRAGTLLL